MFVSLIGNTRVATIGSIVKTLGEDTEMAGFHIGNTWREM